MKRGWLALIAGAGLLCAGACSCGDGGSRGVANAVLVTLDTTRADALGCYGAPDNPTPHLDAFARRALLYERASSVAPLTLPSHCSMMTGLYPPRHTVRENGYWPLPASAVTLAERARDEGFTTAAFVAAVVLDRPFAIDQGFDVYDSPSPQAGGDRLEGSRTAKDVVDRALAWLASRDREQRFFLWVHFFEPHAPYTPPADARKDLSPYAAEVNSMDRELSRLLERLESDGLLASTVVLVAGDHGEAFGEHGETYHGDFCYEPTLHVPLLLAHPDKRRAGERESALVSLVDVYPTLLDALGLEVQGDVDGLSLLRGAPPPERGVYFESYSGWFAQGWSALAGWRDARGKYLHSSAPELYDLAQDPAEEHDQAALRPGDLRTWRLALADVLERPTLAAGPGASVAPELLESIRGLGYAALGGVYSRVPNPLEPTTRPAPRQLAGDSARVYAAANLVNAGRYAEAEPELRAVLENNPLNFVALERLTSALVHLERHAEAIEPLRTLLREGPKKAEWFERLGACLFAAGQREESLEAMRQAVAIEPGNERYRKELAGLLRASGRETEAQRYERP